MDIYNVQMAQTATPFDCTTMTAVTGFSITGNEPTGSTRAVIVKIGTGNWQKWNGNAWTDVTTQVITAESIIAEGNTPGELLALISIPAFVGQHVSVAVALKTLVGSTDMPSISVWIKGKTPQDLYTEIKESDEIIITNSGEKLVNYFVADTTVSGGTLKIEASCYTSGTWTSYVDIGSFQPTMASKVKYRTTATVTEIGVSNIRVDSINAVYTV